MENNPYRIMRLVKIRDLKYPISMIEITKCSSTASPSTLKPVDEALLLSTLKGAYGLSGDLVRLGGERDVNYRLFAADGSSRFVKLTLDKRDFATLPVQTAAMIHVTRQDPCLPVPQPVTSVQGISWVEFDAGPDLAILRVFPFVEGIVSADAPTSAAQRRAIGAVVARIDRALASFSEDVGNEDLHWNLARADRVRSITQTVSNDPDRELIHAALDDFVDKVAIEYPRLRKQVIHNDLNPSNVLVDKYHPDRIVGLIDFGDIVAAPLVNDLAIACAYHGRDPSAPFCGIGDVVAGYHAVTSLEPLELQLVFDLMRARWATIIAIAEGSVAQSLGEADYLRRNCSLSRQGLRRFSEFSREEVGQFLRETCGFRPPSVANTFSGNSRDADLVARRSRRLGPAYKLFYSEPLNFQRGSGVWLYDKQENAYLDAYNNVSSIGHGRREVVEAIARQSAMLNTHTRYLHQGILDYADRLVSTMPENLSQLMLTCTGSEANDLALRIARTVTGARGVIVTATAYHGVTNAVAEVSPSLGLQLPGSGHVQVVPPPFDGEIFARDVAAAIDRLAARGLKPAALLLDMIFMSDGVIADPPSALVAAIDVAKKAGALIIADEVQSGFGRTGHWWGFARRKILPDLVTLGKPMGNGYPVAGVVGQPDYFAAFARDCRYFNTFGGNPVACAAASAVLDVIESEDLVARAASIGHDLMGRLSEIKTRHPAISALRGAGLAISVDIVLRGRHPDESRALATSIVDGMRRRRVLISTTGAGGNTLKIRPPLIFGAAEVDLLVDALDSELARLAGA
jgi:4-aminobutyrate aminotransferase-like enzyme/Ser/Thr protein kinase RdoA (MazF antagonist)